MKKAGMTMVGLLAITVAGAAVAQNWPARPVRIVVPWAPGGATDIISRPLAQKLSEALGQQFIVDNRGGANSLIGTDLVAKAPGDGYTFLFNTLAAFTQNTSYYRKLPYDPEGFTLVAQVGWTPIMMLAPAGTPKPVVDRMHAELGKIMSSPDFRATLVKLGTDETPVMSQADLGTWLKNETARWKRIIELTGIRAD